MNEIANNIEAPNTAESSGWRALLADGLWRNNPATVQLLGLCPLLAVSNTTINGLSLGIATAFTVLLSNVLVSASKHYILQEIRIPIYVIIISGIVTMVGLLMKMASPQVLASRLFWLRWEQ